MDVGKGDNGGLGEMGVVGVIGEGIVLSVLGTRVGLVES